MPREVRLADAALRPDGQRSLLVVNRDQWNGHKVRIAFHDANANADRFFSGPVTTTTFGSAQYQWHPDAKGGFAHPDGPAVKATMDANTGTWFDLPEAPITVLRGTLGKAGK